MGKSRGALFISLILFLACLVTIIPGSKADTTEPEYSFDEEYGFDFNAVNNVMSGTYVPTTVAIYADDDEGPHNSSYMLAVTFHTDGHLEDEMTQYIHPPEPRGLRE